MPWLAAERCAARLITLERIAEDRHFDLLGGSAGALVALLVLHDECEGREPWLLDQAMACGRHLLENRAASPQGPRVSDAQRRIADRIFARRGGNRLCARAAQQSDGDG